MKTKDYGLASLLLCKGHRINKFTCDDQGRVWFEFNDNEETRRNEDDFYANDTTVLVQDFLAAQRRIKSLIFETKRNGYEYENRWNNNIPVNQ